MLAARAVMDWPNGMSAIVEFMREGASSRPGFYGLRKELGPLADFGVDYGAIPQVVAEINAVIHNLYASNGRVRSTNKCGDIENPSDKLLSYREAMKKLGLTSAYLTSIVKK